MVEIGMDVLYDRVEKEMNEADRDWWRWNNWIGHGYNNDTYIDMQAHHFSTYLEDGDFEEYQQYCYMDHNLEEYKIKKAEVMLLQPTATDEKSYEYRRQLKRILWIQNRFTLYQSPEWAELDKKIVSIKFTPEEYLSDWWKK